MEFRSFSTKFGEDAEAVRRKKEEEWGERLWSKDEQKVHDAYAQVRRRSRTSAVQNSHIQLPLSIDRSIEAIGGRRPTATECDFRALVSWAGFKGKDRIRPIKTIKGSHSQPPPSAPPIFWFGRTRACCATGSLLIYE